MQVCARGLKQTPQTCAAAAQRNPCRTRGIRLPVLGARRRPRPHGAAVQSDRGGDGASTVTGYPCPLPTPPQLAMQCSRICGVTGLKPSSHLRTRHGTRRQVGRLTWGTGGLLAWAGIPPAHDAPAAIACLHHRIYTGVPTILYAHRELRVMHAQHGRCVWEAGGLTPHPSHL